ncbi:hypothetical protein AYO47_03130 [Planctomyces sp. SCGC AG-212-M04]|nr:hypothetical protein AYO47_03130 [Planctomyces sp. SCGC AG-212-M04]
MSDMPDPVDELVAGYLQRAQARTDAAPLLERIEADRRLNVSAVKNEEGAAGRSMGRAAGWSLIAAALAMAFLIGRWFDGRSAQAATLLRNVQTVHKQSIDRCYRVQHAPESTSDSEQAESSESILWTRGDRAWTDSAIGSKRIKIGRDETGTIWLAPSSKKGIRFSPEKSQFPKDVETLSQISSLTVPVLVDEVLADFDLKKEAPVVRSDGRRSVIWARLKEGRSHPFLSAAMLEVDVDRNLLARLVLWMHNAKGPNGTVTYTLVDRPSPGESSYRLESHLDADAVIEDQTFKPAK